MEAIFKEYLFSKHYLVHEEGYPCENANDIVLSMMTLFAIRVKGAYHLADQRMLDDTSAWLGIHVPLPFYRGFPQSIRTLSPDQLLFDQLFHYVVTYGFGAFEEAGHSVMEQYLERVAFQEEVTVREYTIVDEIEAKALLKESVSGLLSSTRPLSEHDFKIVKTYITKFGCPSDIASKNTAIRLLVELRDLAFAEFLTLSDVMKVVDYLNYTVYDNRSLKKLNFKNRDRVFLTKLLDAILENGVYNIKDCFEKKTLWCGFLHHIHYQPKSKRGEEFVMLMRQKGNISIYSDFEALIATGDILGAAKLLCEKKGSGALLRQLHYLLSRAKTEEEILGILSLVRADNAMILLQLYIRYRTYVEESYRTFRFTRYNRFVAHKETHKEARRRKTFLSREVLSLLERFIEEHLEKALSGRLGKVYIDESMKKIALPMQENTAMGGIGVLPRGSRIPIADGEKLRAFVYWEKVYDIDLSAIGFDDEGKLHEFSWRTMSKNQSGAIIFSGDETSGYEGGSEYYDIQLDEFIKKHPKIKMLVFTANVYSGSPFSECVCRAGYMMRATDDSGEIYEPKTVRSAFTVNCDSTMSYLFGVDLAAREFVWLNVAKDSDATVAATEATEYLLPYFMLTDAMNYHRFFTMMASETVDTPEEADVAVGDGEYTLKEGAEQIRSYDYEKLFSLMN